jgi:protocatechuate 3,4-dioxygenase beta subunit
MECNMKNHPRFLPKRLLRMRPLTTSSGVFLLFSFTLILRLPAFSMAYHAGPSMPRDDASADSSWHAVLISKEEPGEPMVVTGTVYAADGKTPAPGVEVYVYHTDAEGYYRKGNNNSSNPRLKGTMISNAEGKFEYRTIRPAPYPGGGNPAHVHYVLSRKGFEKQYEELQFEGDPILGRKGRLTDAQKADTFAAVRPIMRDANNVWRVLKDIRLKE